MDRDALTTAKRLLRAITVIGRSRPWSVSSAELGTLAKAYHS